MQRVYNEISFLFYALPLSSVQPCHSTTRCLNQWVHRAGQTAHIPRRRCQQEGHRANDTRPQVSI